MFMFGGMLAAKTGPYTGHSGLLVFDPKGQWVLNKQMVDRRKDTE